MEELLQHPPFCGDTGIEFHTESVMLRALQCTDAWHVFAEEKEKRKTNARRWSRKAVSKTSNNSDADALRAAVNERHILCSPES